jgi:hypothetical protein
MVKVTNELRVYESEGKDIPIGVSPPLVLVSSHGRNSRLVRLRIEGVEVTVSGTELCTALENAMNTGL